MSRQPVIAQEDDLADDLAGGSHRGDSMTAGTGINQDQVEYWNSAAGRKWVEHQAAMDLLLAPVLAQVLGRAALQRGERVLDIGCGTGASTLAAARLVGPQGVVEGFDIAAPLLARAQERAAAEGMVQARFVLADAQVHGFGAGGYDAMISRFGVMFFDDARAAFANMARALRPGGRMVFAAWAALPKNPFFGMALMAVVARLGPVAPMPPGAVGPMAFQDIGMVSDMLGRAGLRQIEAREVALDLTPPGSPVQIAGWLARLGPAARVMAEKGGTAADMAAIEGALAEMLEAMGGPDGVRIPAAVNIFEAVWRAEG